MYLWYTLLFQCPYTLICPSFNKSVKLSKSEGMPALILFAEIFQFRNLLFARSFLTIFEKVDMLRHLPDPKQKTGVFEYNKCFPFACFLSTFKARTGQNRLFGNLNNSTNSNFPPPVFGFQIFISTEFFPLNFTSFQTRSDEYSICQLSFINNSLALNAPK